MKKRNGAALTLVSRVIACGSAKERASSWAFAGEPKNIEEQRLGSLFLVGEIDPEGDEGVPSVLPLVGSKFKQEYYAKPRRRALASFAEALKSANAIFAHVPKKRNPMWLGKVHLASGAFSERTLYFSLVGKIRAYLFRGPATVDLTRRFLTEGRPHPTQLFRHVASGGLEAGDRLLLATPKIFTSLFLEDIRHIVRETPFDEIARQIEMLYATREAHGGLHFVVVEIATARRGGADDGLRAKRGRTEDATDQPRPAPSPRTQPFRLDQKKNWAARGAQRLNAYVKGVTARPELDALTGWLARPWRLSLVAVAIGIILAILLLVFHREVIL